MMHLLILEDEPVAAQQMRNLLKKHFPELTVTAALESVRSALTWFQSHPPPQLILSDIQLADGTCFELFKHTGIVAPVIFTTAYDAYMQQAFKLHSIDYLLKPIDEDELKAAIEKFIRLRGYFQQDLNEKLYQILQEKLLAPVAYKSRFLIKSGDRLSTIQVADVAVLRADDRIVFLHDHAGQKFVLDESLDDLERVLDPAVFFRINRQYLVPVTAIDKIQQHFNGKLHVRLRRWSDTGIFVSREKAKAFKQWLGGR